MKTNNSYGSKAIKALFLATVMMGVVFAACSKDTPPEPLPVINNAVTIDGVTKTIVDAGIDQVDLTDGHYDIRLFIGGDDGVQIMADKALHDGLITDLTKIEESHSWWYWSVVCWNHGGQLIFDTYAEPDTGYPVFTSGTLYVKRLSGDVNGKPVFEIKIEKGKVKAEGDYGDGKEHTISLHYKGCMELSDY